MDKKTKIICDFLVDKEGFYIEQYKSGYEEKLVWIKRFQRGLYTVIITNSVHAVEDEADVIRYLQEKNMPYSLQIVIFTDGKYEPSLKSFNPN
ncbi:MAG: hypothetical protein K5986_00855 [Clostridium sp.]|nr:hypothetical protein [Clostridium sp.]